MQEMYIHDNFLKKCQIVPTKNPPKYQWRFNEKISSRIHPNIDKNGDFNQIKTYPAYRVIFQEERDGGEIKKIGPFWCLVKDYEYLCEFEFSKDQLNKMKPFVIPIEDWDPIKEWKKNRDNESSDLLTMT